MQADDRKDTPAEKARVVFGAVFDAAIGCTVAAALVYGLAATVKKGKEWVER